MQHELSDDAIVLSGFWGKLAFSVLGGVLVLVLAAVGHAIIRTHNNQTRIDNLRQKMEAVASEDQINGVHRRLDRMESNLEYIRQFIVESRDANYPIPPQNNSSN